MEAVYLLPGILLPLLIIRWRIGRWVVCVLLVVRLVACVVIGGVNAFLLKHVHAGVVQLAVAAVTLIPLPHLLRASRIDPARGKGVAFVVAALAATGASVALIVLGTDPATARMPTGELMTTGYTWADLVGAAIASIVAGAMALAPPLERRKLSTQAGAG